MKNLWLYTEERPRINTIQTIVSKFASDRNLPFSFSTDMHILPIMEKGLFTFIYKIEGIKCEGVKDVFVSIVSGSSSFVDYLVFYKEKLPIEKDRPEYLIEETKTDDKESRNTGVYQRCSKFVYGKFFYPDVPQIMLYNLKVTQKDTPTPTYIFGTKMLKTLDIQILGKNLDEKLYQPFQSIDELIALKNAMPLTKNGVSVRIKKSEDKIEISAKLEKAGTLSSDPSIGMISIISSCLRKLGWTDRIVITLHGLKDQKSVGIRNKFILIANKLNIELNKLTIPKSELVEDYWKIQNSTEKIGTIFTSILCEEFSNSIAIYENHQGCERGYFISAQNSKNVEYLVVPKYADRAKYKAGDKKAIIFIPDLVIYDRTRNIVIDGEGKTYDNRIIGFRELRNLSFFEKHFIQKYYPKSKIDRSLIVYGSDKTTLRSIDRRIGLLLNEKGSIILGANAPLLFKEALKNLLSL